MNRFSTTFLTASCAVLLVAALGAELAAQQSTTEGAGLPVAFRTRVSTHYRNPDGSLKAVITIRPQNYLDARGQWHPIDTRLHKGDEHAFINLTNGLQTRFAHSAEQGVVLQGIGQPAVTMTPVRFIGLGALGQTLRDAQPQAAHAVLHGDSTVHYPALFSGVVDEYIVDSDRLKHNLVLERIALNDYEETARIGGEFCVTIPEGLTARVTDAPTRVRFLNKAGECVYEIGAVIATDAAGEAVAGELGVRVDEDKLFLSMTIETSWALAENRSWPVRIDPTFSVQPDSVLGKDTHVRDGAPNENRGTYSDITVNWSGNVTQEALVAFDLTSITTTAVVTTARFEAWHRANTVTGHIWEINEITQAWDEMLVTWATKPTYNATPATTLTYTNGSPNVWRVYTGMETVTQSWVATPANNHGFRMFNTTNPNASAYHRSSDYATATERPQFIADYIDNIAPTIDIPTAGSTFTGSMGTGFTATVAPGTLSGLDLELNDADQDDIEVVGLVVAPSTPGGIVPPSPSQNNPSGTIISFTGDATLAIPGTYTWTITIDDGSGQVMADASITVLDEAPSHSAGIDAVSGDGSAATPYHGEVGLGGMPSLALSIVDDSNEPQTLTETAVVADPSNPSSIFQVAYGGTGNSGTITATATGTVTYLDLGVHVFTVTVTDGTNPIDVVVSVAVLNQGNVQPNVAGGGPFSGTRAAGFVMSVDPGQALTGATLTATDLDADDIEIVSVVATPAAGLTGVTAPATAAPAAGPVSITWGGTADASEIVGDYMYDVTISDGITPPLTFTVTITLVDLAPVHTPVAGVLGTGTSADPYPFASIVGATPSHDVCTLADANLSQSVTLASVIPDPLNPVGGSGFDVTFDGTTLTVSALGALKSKDVGTHRFTANMTDGNNTVPVVIRVKVNTAPSDEEGGGSCTGVTEGSNLWLLLLALAGIGAIAVVRARRA